MIVAGGARSRTLHRQVDPALQKVPLSLFLTAVLGGAVRAALHAAGTGEVGLEVIS